MVITGGPTAMKRILVASLPAVGDTFSPPPDETRHLVQALRAKADETIEILDGAGGMARARIVSLGKRDCRLVIEQILTPERESPLQLDLLLALPVQRGTFDSMLPGLVQLGVNHIDLVETQFGGRLKTDRDKYARRLDEIARQSLKQCGRLRLPTISFTGSWQAALHHRQTEACYLFHPSPTADNNSLSREHQAVRLAFGPEGGFSEDEAATACDAGWRCISMGPRILKMETAVTGAAYWAQARWGDGLT